MQCSQKKEGEEHCTPQSRVSGGRSDSRRWSKFLWEIALAVRYGDSCCEVRLLPSATNCPLSTISLDMRPAAGWPTSSSVVRECGHFLTGLPALWDYCFFGAQHLPFPSFMPTTGPIGQRYRRG